MEDRRNCAPLGSSLMRLLCAVAVVCLPLVSAFNADLATAVKYSGPDGSEFGVSLSFHSSGTKKMLLVGAPLANYTNPAWTAGGTLQRTGVLYQCPWSTTPSTTCQQLQVDTVAPTQGLVPEIKSNMRMGQSVVSVGPDAIVMVCASRYGKTLPCQANYGVTLSVGQCFGNPKNTGLYNNLGKCVILPSNLQLNGTPTDFAPVDVVFPYSKSTLDSYWGQNYVNAVALKNLGWGGLNTPSFGLTLSARPKNLTHRFPRDQFDVHGPTLIHSRGQVVHADLSSGTPTNITQQIINSYPAFDAGGALATAEGDFDGTGKLKLAWGRPFVDWTPNVVCQRNCRDAKQGDVWIIDGSLGNANFYDSNYKKSAYGVLESKQFAEGFGMSLLAEDTNNDGIHELLVGAPNHMDYSRSNEPNGYDFGIVYIYSSKLQVFLKNRTSVEGYLYFNQQNRPWNFLSEYDMSLAGAPASRFGSSIASVGDVDRDGYPDVAIGAPGEILSNGAAGAVYIYVGSSTGLVQTPAQRITPSDGNTRGFGSSLAYGWDIDENGYSDIAVGALDSSNAFLFRSRPVITVQLQFNVVSDIDATNRSCPFVDGQYRACFNAQVCAQYQRPIQPTNVVISYTLSVDDSSFQLKLGTTSISQLTAQMTVATPGLLQCQTHTVFVKTSIPDLCKPANVSLTKWSLVDRTSTPTDLAPILDRNQAPLTPIGRSVNLVPLCSGSSCNPDLVTSFPASQVYVTSGIGTSAPVSLAIRNVGMHPACSPTFELHLSQPGVVFQSVDERIWLCSERGLQVLRCQPAAQNRHYGAIGPGSTATFNATLYSSKTHIPRDVTSFALNATVSSGNAESNTTNNPSERRIEVRRSSLLGVSIADELDLSVALIEGLRSAVLPTKLQDLPLDLVSTFQLSNRGPSSATVTDLALKYPLESAGTGEKQTIYYLTAIEASLADVRCNSSALVNVNKYDLSSEFVLNDTVKFYPVLPSTASQSPQTAYKECSASVCSVAIVCTVPALDVNTAVQVRLRWRVYTTYIQSLLEERSKVPLSVSSSIVRTTPAALYSTTLSPQMATRSTEFTVPQAQSPEATNSGIIVGVVVGCIVFILLVFAILFKSGFFKSKKPEDMHDASGVSWRAAQPEAVSAPPTEDEYEEVRAV